MKQVATLISKNLLVATTLSFIAGITITPWLTNQALGLVSSLQVFLVPLLVSLLFLYYFKRNHIVIVLLPPLFLGIGCHHTSLRLQLPENPHHIYNQITVKSEVIAIGTMTTMAVFDGKSSKTTIEVKRIRFEKSTEYTPSKGKIQLRFKGEFPKKYLPGDILAIRVELKRPTSYKTPGTFDYAQYLAQKDIWVTGFVRSKLFVHKLDEKLSTFHKLRYFPEKVRNNIGRQIDRSLSDDSAGLYRAILLGDRSLLSDSVLEAFKGSGTFHILAISGLHMSVIGAMLYGIIYWLLSRSEMLLLKYNVRKIAALSCLPLLLFYSQLAGTNAPVIRSVIMSCIVIFALCTDRQKSPAPLVAAAAFLILVYNPLQLYTVSFQLSFSAIISIVFLLPLLKTFLFEQKPEENHSQLLSHRIFRWALAGILVSTVATIATGPISLYAFNRISFIGPIANLVIEPLFCLWSLAFGFIAIPFVFIFPDLSSLLFQIGAKGLQAGLFAASQFSSIPYSSVHMVTPPLWLVFSWYGILVLLSILFFKQYKKSSAFLAAILIFSVIVFTFSPGLIFRKNKQNFTMNFLDVGQGTATVIEYPSGYRLLIDGGAMSYSTSIGERLLAPFLWEKGINTIDAIAITHPDGDHYNGLPFIIEHFNPKTVWVRDTTGHDQNYKDFISFASRQQDISVVVPEDGLLLFSSEGETLKCVANIGKWKDNSVMTGRRDAQNSGLILQACANDFCTLFPGDVTQIYEDILSDNYSTMESDILLSAHHGSSSSNSEKFVQAVSPASIIVSAGHSRRQHFPSSELRALCETFKINLFTTAEHGTIEIIAKNNRHTIYGYKKRNDNPLLNFERVELTNSQ